jgi:hypothetical protein
MKKILLALTLFSIALGALNAQYVPDGINYQGVLLGADGAPMSNSRAVLRISMVAGENTAYFSEIHQVRTDDQGQFSLVIGGGKPLSGTLADVPFGQESISLNVELEDKRSRQFRPLGGNRLLAVPYAMHANTASRIEAPAADAEKQQSIFWITTGNSLTKPPHHFVGTRDNQDLVIKTNNVERMRITKTGQFKITGGTSGASTDEKNYPLHVTGGIHGINIKVNGSRTALNNFMTFGDIISHSWGAIQGQSNAELLAYYTYVNAITDYIFYGTNLGIRVGAWTAMAAANAAEAPCGAGGAVPKSLGATALATELAGVINSSVTWTGAMQASAGVVYYSGFADYAEWLERAQGEMPMEPGTIVGVKGGVISRNTENGASHFLVVSQNPILLGNNPAEDREGDFEMVSFMGQVRVKVAGTVNKGDFILPSGNGDGLGIAVHPSKMQTGDFARVIGVAWENAKGDLPYHYINTAVGVNAADMSKKADLLNRRVENILDYLKGKAPLMEEDELSLLANSLHTAARTTRMEKLLADADVDVLLDKYSPFLSKVFAGTEAQMQKHGVDLTTNPLFREFRSDPAGMLKAMRRNPDYITQWAALDRKLQGGLPK